MKKFIAIIAVTFAIGCNWGNSGCDSCSCDAGCCDMDDTVCAAADCACVCKK